MKLPDEIAVMSLPNAILFPQAVLPLHIFEPRYRRMLKDALETHRLFSVALMREEPTPGQPEPHPYDVGCVGIISASFQLPDGTSNVLIQGLHRVRFTEFLPEAPYPVATIEPLETTHEPDAETNKLASRIGKLAKLRAAAGKTIPNPLLQALSALGDAEMMADLVSFTLLTDLRQKQQLLEMLDLRLRLQKLLQCLERQIKQLKVQKQLKPTKTDKGFSLN
ncbi:MAG: LON peptidase substrate-binding domain-containing protein [Verrucomicrobia bacterium]|nr:LON peptidase substrate-binding domain-containing protein [Verrucomicrobiota bacterium]